MRSGRFLLVGTLALLTMVPGLSLVPGTPAETGATGHPTGACGATNFLSHAGWALCWQQDDARAQGIEVYAVQFRGEPVAARLGLPFALTEYATHDHGPYKDLLGVPTHNPGNGYGAMTLDTSECPRFVGTGNLLHNARLCVEDRLGPEPMLVVWGRYDLLDYRFLQGYALDGRGVLEPFVRLGGRLVDGDLGEGGRDHLHHLYWRLDLEVGAPGGDRFERYGPPADPLQVARSGPCAAGAPGSLPRWTHHETECALHKDDGTTRWRISDTNDTNTHGNPKSIEIDVHSDTAPDAFSTFDAMVLQDHGPNSEIGYEVPAIPLGGDAPLAAYHTPAERLTDPVLWIAQHVFHDPRDEDRGSMTYHDAAIQLRPRDLFDSNPGEDTYRR